MCHCQERDRLAHPLHRPYGLFFLETGGAKSPTEILLRDMQKQSTKKAEQKSDRGGHSRNNKEIKNMRSITNCALAMFQYLGGTSSLRSG